jgi:beta-glucanase (GH16 family)
MKIIFLFVIIEFIGFNLHSQYSNNCEAIQVVPVSDGICNSNPWVLVFEDDFDGNTLDLSKWEIPYQGVNRDFDFSGRKQWNANTGTTPSIPISNNIQVSNGTLKLIARNEPIPIQGTFVTNWGTNPPTTSTSNFNYSSGEINTKQFFGHGAYEIRCKIPKGKGFFPAFWMYGDPNQNEIDVFEFWNEETCILLYDSNRLSRNPHFNMIRDFDLDGSTNQCSKAKYSCTHDFFYSADYSQDFHIYTVIWDTYKIQWFIDGNLERTETRFSTILGQQVDCNGVNAFGQYILTKAFPQDVNMQIILDLAIQNNNGNNPDVSTPFPSQLEVDYVRYFKRMPCTGDLVYSSTASLGLQPTLYNVIQGQSITLQSAISIPDQKQLKLIAKDFIEFKPDFETVNGSHLETKIDVSICDPYQVPILNASDQVLPVDNVIANQDENLSLDEVINIEDEIKIYPNPTNEKLYIEFVRNDKFSISLLDSKGILILDKKLDLKNEEIDLSELSQGVYFLKINNEQGNQILVKRIIRN